MPEKKGDRRGLNPRQLEPQSTPVIKLSLTYKNSAAASGRAKSTTYGSTRTGCVNRVAVDERNARIDRVIAVLLEGPR